MITVTVVRMVSTVTVGRVLVKVVRMLSTVCIVVYLVQVVRVVLSDRGQAFM